jgi:hypothetical protein
VIVRPSGGTCSPKIQNRAKSSPVIVLTFFIPDLSFCLNTRVLFRIMQIKTRLSIFAIYLTPAYNINT